MMKRALFLVVALGSLATFTAGCGPEEKYCYDQHQSCKAAADEAAAKEQARKDAEEAERLRRLDAGATD